MGVFGRTMPNGDAKMLLDAEVRTIGADGVSLCSTQRYALGHAQRGSCLWQGA